jgi:glycerol-3-phosphate acyltransferase PlsY
MAETSLTTLLLVLAGYLLGSIPFGILLSKIFGGKDVRQHGSGNIGATNVSRVAGPSAGILTLVLDAAKGGAAVWLAARFTDYRAGPMILAGLAALLGHCFPVWLQFKGGKGVATALGIFIALCPLAALAAFILFLLVVLFWRYVSLGHAPPLAINLGTLFASALIFYKHYANMQRLADGTEPKYPVGKSKGEEA